MRKLHLDEGYRCDSCRHSKHVLIDGQEHLSAYCTHPEGELIEHCLKYEYEKKPYPLTVGDTPSVGRPPILRKAIKVWLVDALKASGGSLPAKTVLYMAEKKGLKLATLYRAKKELHIKSVPGRKDGKIVWHWV